MYSHIHGAAIDGVDGCLIQVEVDVSKGFPSYTMVGYLASEVKEARERVTTALKNSGVFVPPSRIVVNLSPAGIRKEGTALDLPIAVALMSALDLVASKKVTDTMFIGELSLDGKICPVPGVLPMVCGGLREGIKRFVVPAENGCEAAAVSGVEVIPVSHLPQLVAWLQGKCHIESAKRRKSDGEKGQWGDFSEIYGQELLKYAVETAVAGRHHLLMLGAPGSGKTMAAKRIPSILPEMSESEALEVRKIYSVTGLMKNTGMILERPFRQPHHSITTKALFGGGPRPKPGEVSLAHHGVLFLDEFAEFRRETVESLREPLESQMSMVNRVQGSYEFPADFMLVAAMNPCPCGYFPNRQKCQCSMRDIRRYLNKLSLPLLDRMDMGIEVAPLDIHDLKTKRPGLDSKTMKDAVQETWKIQRQRYRKESFSFNSRMPASAIKKYCSLTKDGKDMLWEAYEKRGFSGRGYHKVLRTARTVADLSGSEKIDEVHLAEALSYKGLDEKYWTREEGM